ncbi:MAG: hypothetical protein JNK11_15075 [Alphaproteobacteria bacterium]|nr:hypothetical protein [Alphaproteobacteria bacterium]
MQPKYVEIVKKGGLPALAQSLASEPAVRRDYFFRCGVAGWIGTTREWTGKLALLLDHLDKGGLTPDIVVTIDEVMAEVLDGADSVKEVLGAQRDLSGALRTVTQVASGHYVGLRGAPPLLERITKALKRGDMPLTQGVLYERVQRALSGIQQLTREGSGDTEKAAFKGLVADLCLQGVMSGGPDVAVGVTNRARIVLAQGNDLTVDKAIQEVAKLLPSGGARLSYLLELGRSSLAGGDHGQTIVKHLDAAVPALPAGRALFPEKLDAPAVQRAAGALRAVAAAVALEGAWKSAVGAKLQGV